MAIARELTGIGFAAVNGYLVSDRLAQDIPQLDNIKGGVWLTLDDLEGTVGSW